MVHRFNSFYKYFLWTIIALFFTINSSHATSRYNELKPTIVGSVKTKNAEPVIGAFIIVTGTMVQTVTDISGNFELYSLKSGDYKIEISALGFKKIEQHISINNEEQFKLNIIFEEEEIQFPEIVIMGKNDRIFSKIPGSVSFINAKEIQSLNPISGNEIFRRTPGLHVVDEEGAGMRVNIGIRGLDPDRSRSVLILEDGIPVALAPYGEPEMYYTPTIDRMSGVEIMKGAGQILYGPQTIGGVINYLTSAPPSESTGKIRLQTGQGGYVNGLVTYGNSYGNTGFNISVLKKRADKLGLTNFDITDINAKIAIKHSSRSTFGLKFGIYNEISNSTYIGLTQTMYDNGGQDFTHMAPDDLLKVKRYSMSLHHEFNINPSTKLKTTAFAYTTTRDWRRQDFVSNGDNNNKPNNWTGVTWGDETIPDGAIFMRNSTGNRNRHFEVIGTESNLTKHYRVFNSDQKFQTGVRFLHEKAYEQRINGSKLNANSGALVEDETRPGNALSAYIHNMTSLFSNFEIHYGIRFEHLTYGRNIDRRSFLINGQNMIRDTFLNNSNQISQLIPGSGFTWKPNSKINVFGGIHTGFAPPRTKDAISNIGEVYDLNAERSTNLELGLRTIPSKGINIELTAFRMNFSNQIIPISESSGGTGTGLVNGGKTVHQGIESALNLDFSEILGWTKNRITLNTNLTFTDAHFVGDRQIENKKLNGNKTPYAPSWIINSKAYFESANGFSIGIVTNYVSNQFSDELNTDIAAPDGRNGLIPAYTTLDAHTSYKIAKWNSLISLAVKNMTNERYIVSRRPQGIRLGLPRLLVIGWEFNF